MKQELRVGLALLAAGILSADAGLAKTASRKAHKAASSAATKVVEQNSDTKRSETVWIKVVPAERLIHQDLVSNDGRLLGQIDSVMLDVTSGDIVYVIVSTDDDQLAIPFRALEFSGWREGDLLKVRESYRRILRNSPRAAGERIGQDLGDPRRIARTSRAFGVPTPHGYVVPPDPNRETLPNRYLLIRPRNIAAFEARQDARQEANGAGGADTARAEEIRDRVVLGADGKPVGTVDYVMLDIKAGRIAYLLLSSGDFLGLGGEWVPVPPEALSWPPDKETAVLKNGLKRSALKPLQRSELPNFIRGAQLEALYQRFDVAPYQQQSQLE